MAKKIKKVSTTPASKVVPAASNSATGPVQEMDIVKKNFDGLHGEIEKLPAGQLRNNISRWAGDTYLSTTRAFFEIGSALGFRSVTAAQ